MKIFCARRLGPPSLGAALFLLGVVVLLAPRQALAAETTVAGPEQAVSPPRIAEK